MRLALSVLLRLLAPYLSFVCEEVWSWSQQRLDPSRRLADPRRARRACRARTNRRGRPCCTLTEALNAIRKGKADQKVSIGTPVQQVVYQATDEAIACLKLVERDLKAASRAEALMLQGRRRDRRSRSR